MIVFIENYQFHRLKRQNLPCWYDWVYWVKIFMNFLIQLMPIVYQETGYIINLIVKPSAPAQNLMIDTTLIKNV